MSQIEVNPKPRGTKVGNAKRVMEMEGKEKRTLFRAIDGKETRVRLSLQKKKNN